MGCWNYTCQISQLPIHAGEPVRFVLLTKNYIHMDNFESSSEDRQGEPNEYAGREGVYATDFWSPQFVPVRAKYNDYGSVEHLDEECHNWRFIRESIDARMIEIEQGPNQYHDPSVKRGMPLDQLLDVLGEGRLRFSEDHHHMAIPIAQTMIREDVYQSLLTIPLEETWWIDKGADKYTPESIYNHGIKLFSNPPIVPKSLQGLGDDFLFEMMHDEHDHKNYFTSGLRESEGGRGLRAYRQWIRKGLKDGTLTLESESFKTLIRDMAEFMYVKSVHDSMRMGWHMGVGQGSQSSNLKMANTFHRNIAKIATNVRRARRW